MISEGDSLTVDRAAETSQPAVAEQLLRACVAKTQSRLDLWAEFIQSVKARAMAEIGVYRGDFAVEILRRCQGLTSYCMIDPWRHLSDWNKPANHEDAILEKYFQETKARTEFAASRRIILRGKTTEVIEQIADGELDFAYIDADHTLKGIAIDLIRVYPKVRMGGFIGGDDFTRSVWEHKTTFEPTLVFPFAVYFAEAVGATIYGLPYSQFCLQKTETKEFKFVDLTGTYDDTGLRSQFTPEKVLKLAMFERFPLMMRALGRARSLVRKGK
jgi:hypothetical protein